MTETKIYTTDARLFLLGPECARSLARSSKSSMCDCTENHTGQLLLPLVRTHRETMCLGADGRLWSEY